jgi:CRISPR-associated protein Csm2
MKIINNENYVDKARDVIEKLKNCTNDRGWTVDLLSTSKIRNVLAMTANIYNEVMLLTDSVLTDKIKEQITYLRIRCIYEAGRNGNEPVKYFVKESGILEILPSIESRKDYILFSHYMEALVAWRKYLGGKDD